jgi:glycerol-3-phosphate acyltransferase PlsX
MRIGVDGMGGDHAPGVVISGVVQAAREYNLDVVIVGPEDALQKELARHKSPPKNIQIVHASEVIGMDEMPVVSVRKKRDSSINVLVNLAKEGKVDAIFSAGNTGAMVCAATLGLRLLEGVERPGIAIIFRGLEGTAMIADVGANIVPKPKHLLQYAIMCDTYSRYILHKENPTIALLNVGEEETKGTEFVKEAHQLLSASKLNFIGNIEGRHIFDAKIDVIICDGFIGNAVLKVSEGIAEAFATLLRREMNKNIFRRAAGLLCLPAFKALKKDLDYSEYGGAPLLGVDGICIIGHGRSNAKAIKNAIRVSNEFAKNQVNQHIVEAIRIFDQTLPNGQR